MVLLLQLGLLLHRCSCSSDPSGTRIKSMVVLCTVASIVLGYIYLAAQPCPTPSDGKRLYQTVTLAP